MLQKIRNEWKERIESVLAEFAQEKGITLTGEITVGKPPKAEQGDLAFAMFTYAKSFAMAPALIAKEVASRLEKRSDLPAGQILVLGPYVNIKIDTAALAGELARTVLEEGDDYGRGKALAGRKVMIEFSCPNTNKPLHLGHMRNDSLGMAVSELLKSQGAEVMKVNLINNRGVHICKSMWAYKTFGGGETPETTGEKGDHFVGRYYVRYADYEKECVKKLLDEHPDADEKEKEFLKAQAEAQANREPQEMLVKWEEGDEETIALWKKMNDWTLQGLDESYRTMGISFDKFYYESDTYKLGKSEVMKGLDMGVFYRAPDGSVQIDLAPIGLDKKILLRKDGTSIYITQDLGTAVSRHEDWPFDSLIYVVASEQQYHFKVLFYCLKQLGYKWADELHHLSYGMVNLPSGRMKSREGTVVDADDLVEDLARLAKEEIVKKERESALEDPDRTAHDIALGALNYYLLQVDPERDMIFNPAESISFNGNTGPYLQYMGARISSMLSKFEAVKDEYSSVSFDPSLLVNEDEKTLVKLIASFPEIVTKSAMDYDPSVLCALVYDIAKVFSHYYHDNQVLKAENPELVVARITLSKMVLQCLKNAFRIIGIPFLSAM